MFERLRLTALGLAGAVTALLTLSLAPAANAAGTFTWASQQTGLCLDGNASGQIYPHQCNTGNAYQQWTFSGSASAGRAGTNASRGTGLCLSAWGYTEVAGRPCDSGDANQLWSYNRSTHEWTNGASGLCLDGDYGRIYLQWCNGGQWQKWH
jgi:hypothetical protein